MRPVDDKLRDSLLRLEGLDAFERFMDWLEGSLQEERSALACEPGEVPVRWMQGSVQTLDEIVQTVRGNRAAIEKRGRRSSPAFTA